MGRSEYIRECLRRSWRGSFGRAQSIAAIVAVLGAAVAWLKPPALGIVNTLVWAVPLAVFAATFAVTWTLAAHDIIREREAERDAKDRALTESERTLRLARKRVEHLERQMEDRRELAHRVIQLESQVAEHKSLPQLQFLFDYESLDFRRDTLNTTTFRIAVAAPSGHAAEHCRVRIVEIAPLNTDGFALSAAIELCQGPKNRPLHPWPYDGHDYADIHPGGTAFFDLVHQNRSGVSQGWFRFVPGGGDDDLTADVPDKRTYRITVEATARNARKAVKELFVATEASGMLTVRESRKRMSASQQPDDSPS